MMTENTEFFEVRSKKVVLRTPRYVYARLLLTYTLIYTLAFIFGCILFHLLDYPRSTEFDSSIIAYFSLDFSACASVSDCPSLLLSASSAELSHLFVAFTAGFTMLCGLILSSMLIFRGFALGFSISYLAYALREGFVVIERPALSMVFYAVLCAVSAAILLSFSVKSAMFCDDFKALCGNTRKIIRSKALYSHIFRFLIAFGAFLTLNLLRCLF